MPQQHCTQPLRLLKRHEMPRPRNDDGRHHSPGSEEPGLRSDDWEVQIWPIEDGVDREVQEFGTVSFEVFEEPGAVGRGPESHERVAEAVEAHQTSGGEPAAGAQGEGLKNM